jgi:hypothetical protein
MNPAAGKSCSEHDGGYMKTARARTVSMQVKENKGHTVNVSMQIMHADR